MTTSLSVPSTKTAMFAIELLSTAAYRNYIWTVSDCNYNLTRSKLNFKVLKLAKVPSGFWPIIKIVPELSRI